MTVIAIFNQKGGVGKTTTALNLAAALARTRRTFGIDLDPQAHLSTILGVTAGSGEDTVLSLFQHTRSLRDLMLPSPSNIGVIPSHIELSKVDTMFGKGYDVVNRLNTSLRSERFLEDGAHVVIDCCPMIGVLSLNAIFASECLLVPVSADHLSYKGALQIEKTLKALEPVLKRRVQRRYVLTRFDPGRRVERDVRQMLEEHFGEEVCRTHISESVSLAESPAYNKTIFEHAPNSRGARNFTALLEELLADRFID